MTDTPHTVNAYGVDPNTIDAAHADRVARALGLPHAVRIGCGGFLHGISRGVLTITPEPFDLSNPRIVSVPWALVAGLGALRARPLEWEPDGEPSASHDAWCAKHMGFIIIFDGHMPEGKQFEASWGDDAERFGTLEAAEQWCQDQADAWVREVAAPAPDDIDRQAAEIARLRAEVEALRVDAERLSYARGWIRQRQTQWHPTAQMAGTYREGHADALMEALAAIDAARTPEGRSDG